LNSIFARSAGGEILHRDLERAYVDCGLAQLSSANAHGFVGHLLCSSALGRVVSIDAGGAAWSSRFSFPRRFLLAVFGRVCSLVASSGAQGIRRGAILRVFGASFAAAGSS